MAPHTPDDSAFRDETPCPPGWPSAEVASLAAMIDRCHKREDALIAEQVARAKTHWDSDRRRQAEELAAGLGRKPAAVLAQLRHSSHGCAVIIDLWLELAYAHACEGRWTRAQRVTALNLLNVPRELREAPSPLDPAPGGDPTEAIRACIHAEINRHKNLRAALAEVDALERSAAVAGLGPDTPEMIANRREEEAYHRRLRAAVPPRPRSAPPSPRQPRQPLGQDRVVVERQPAQPLDVPPPRLLRVVPPGDLGPDARNDPRERQADRPAPRVAPGRVEESQPPDPAGDLQPGLFLQFPPGPDLGRLVDPQEAPGQGPAPGERLPLPQHQQHPDPAPPGREDDQVNRHVRPRILVAKVPFHDPSVPGSPPDRVPAADPSILTGPDTPPARSRRRRTRPAAKPPEET